jgi:Zn-dependent oligopeptidase
MYYQYIFACKADKDIFSSTFHSTNGFIAKIRAQKFLRDGLAQGLTRAVNSKNSAFKEVGQYTLTGNFNFR